MPAHCFVNSCITGLTELWYGRTPKNVMSYQVTKRTTSTLWANRWLNKMLHVYVIIKCYDVGIIWRHFEGEWAVHVCSQTFVDFCRERLFSSLRIQVLSFKCVNTCLMNLLVLFFKASFIGERFLGCLCIATRFEAVHVPFWAAVNLNVVKTARGRIFYDASIWW
jgi:hypothetical protein